MNDFMPAAGSLRSTADDMLRFLSACLQPPDDAPGPALTLSQQPFARLVRGMDVGLCWLILTSRGHDRVVWHNGGTWGFRSFAEFVPAKGTAVVVMSNTARGVDRLGRHLVEQTAGRPQA